MKFSQFEATQTEVVDQLRKLDIFSEVNLIVDIQKTPKRLGEMSHVVDVNLKVDLTEKNWKEPLTFGIYYGNEDAATFRAKGSFKNIFGRGEKLFVNTKLNVSNYDLTDAYVCFFEFLLLLETSLLDVI
jgi:outer membrane protein assembly factor BamA